MHIKVNQKHLQIGFLLKGLPIMFVLMSLLGCDILFWDDETLIPLDTRIHFKVLESFDNNAHDSYETITTPEIFIDMLSEKSYPSTSYYFAVNHRVVGRRILIGVDGIKIPGAGNCMVGPIGKRIKIGRIHGAYELTIRGRDFENEYAVNISDSLITIEGTETPDTKPSITSIFRYPKNSFAYLCGTTLQDSSLCEDFIDTLKSVINVTEFKFLDIAESPYPPAGNGNHYNAEPKFFYYKSEEDFEKIEDVMRTFKRDHFPDNNGVSLRIINWMNKRVRSWLL